MFVGGLGWHEHQFFRSGFFDCFYNYSFIYL
jgi:hypothetical protein